MEKLPGAGGGSHYAGRRYRQDLDRVLGGRARHAVHFRAARSRLRTKSHIYFDPATGGSSPGSRARMASRCIAGRRPTPAARITSPSTSRAVWTQAVQRLEARGIKPAVRDRMFMDSTTLRIRRVSDPARLYKFRRPRLLARGRPVRRARFARRRGDREGSWKCISPTRSKAWSSRGPRVGRRTARPNP